LSVEELAQVNLDLQQATGTILGVLPEVTALRAQIVKELPGFDIAQFDKLEDGDRKTKRGGGRSRARDLLAATDDESISESSELR